MGKGINKLSKSQKNAPAKSQTRISSFFGRATTTPAPPASAATDPGLRAAPAPAPAGVPRRSPQNRPILIDVTGDAVSPNASPLPAPVLAAPATPPSAADLDDSCELIPCSGGWAGHQQRKENRLTAIAGRTSAGAAAAGAGAARSGDAGGDRGVSAGAFGGADAAPLDGTRLVHRLTKRPARSGPGLSPDRKRPTRPSGVAAYGSRSSPRKNGDLFGEVASKRGRDAVVVDLERALRAGETAAGVPTTPLYVADGVPAKRMVADSGIDGDGNAAISPVVGSGNDGLLPSIDSAVYAASNAASVMIPAAAAASNAASVTIPAAAAASNAASVTIPAAAASNAASVTIPAAAAASNAAFEAISAAAAASNAASEAIRAAAAASDAAFEANLAAAAAISPQKRPRHGTPERDEESELLFESVADLFSSPFKEETAARCVTDALPLRSADASLPAWQRFDRYSVSFVDRRTDGSTALSLQAAEPGHRDRCISLRGSWAATRVAAGDTVHVLGAPSDVIDNVAGQLVVSPDRLLSGTAVVAAVFCARKAVLGELFRGLEPGNKAMLVGTLVHQLFQEVMSNRECTAAGVRSRVADLLRQNSTMSAAYGGKLSSTELAEEVDQFVAPILAWVRRYTEWGRNAEVATPIARTVAAPAPSNGEIWDGRVTELKDIEENYWSPRLGIKGKIDLTVQVKCRKRAPQVLPLELKTGRPSFSAEHQGQVTLYSMMTSERRVDPGAGLLLYLRTGAMREVAAGPHQQRDLLQLRNEMAHHLRAAPAADPADPAGPLLLPPLPDVIRNERACQRCPHLVTCTAYQRPCDPPHAVPGAAAHLSAAHLSYFLHWSLLLRLESAQAAERASMARLWCRPAADRQARGQALAACRLLGVQRTPAGWLHRLQRAAAASASQLTPGDLVLLGTDQRLAVCMGSLVELAETEAHVLLDRDLTSYPGAAEERYHVDKCEYQVETSMGTYFSSLARLLENTEHSRRLRELLIDRRPPSFLPGLGRLVITKCRAILRPLNKLQQRALLRVMMAEDYLLIQGMPGTGKTSTIVALVRLLVTMGRSVLLASYTHSAVDTVLLKLKEHCTDFVRLGRSSRVHPELLAFSSENLTKTLSTPEELQRFYDSKPVVATTCLGTNHPVFQRRKFDICIIDEASQIVQPAAVAPVLLAGRFVLVGDPEQLPPVIQSGAARRRGMDESLFSRLAGDVSTVQLTVQYRMNRTLTAAANHLTYEGRLSCGSPAVDGATMQPVQLKPGDAPWLAAALDPALDRSLLLLDSSDLDWRHTADKHGSVSNGAEAALVAHIAAEMLQRGVPADRVGVIAPYRGQVKLLRAALPAALEVNTVDQYQGRDKSVIIYSCTRTAGRATATQQEEGSEAGTDILSDHRRLTVAVTRAKHKLVLVGRRDALVSYPPFCRLFAHLGQEHTLRLTPGQVSSLADVS